LKLGDSGLDGMGETLHLWGTIPSGAEGIANLLRRKLREQLTDPLCVRAWNTPADPP
jgi:hypothetical protein